MFILIISPCMLGQVQIEEISDLPVDMHAFYTAYNTVNNNIYLFGGREPGDHIVQAHDWIWKYNLTNNSWEELITTLPYEVGFNISAAYYNGHFYMGPGFATGTSNGWGVNNKIIDVDLVSGVGSEINAFPYDKIWGMSSIEADGKIYFFGGHNGADISGIFMYDPTSGLLTQVADMINPKPYVLPVLSNNGWIYYFVGDSYSRSKRFERFNPQTGIVELLNAFLPYTARSYVSNTWYIPNENAIYFFQSQVDNPVLYKYDIDSDQIINTSIDVPGNYAFLPAVKNVDDQSSIYAFKLNPNPSTNYPLILMKLTLDLDGLVAYYPFNGNANDESGNGHHGSIISNPFFIADRHGNQNSALSFDGIDDWIEVNSSSLFPSDAITMCYWVNRDGNDITSLQNYISKEHSFQSYNQDYSGGENRFASGYWLGSPGVWKNYYTNFEVTDLNEWIFYAFSYDNNTQTAKSYVNGVLDSTVVETDPNYYLRSSGHKMYIGRNGSANVYHIQGFLDDIRIYDRALTDEEIFQLYDITQVGNQVTVTSPNGGEVWGMGTEQFITWSSIDIIDVKIEFSFNNGASWELVNESVPSTGIYSWNVPAVHTIQGLIKISDVTNEDIFDISDGVFTIEPVTSADIFNSTIPDQFELKQNYPNPFNPITTIYYGLPYESSVRILIFDILGSNVMSFTKDNQPAGYHAFKFNATSLPSGIYFYRIQAGDFIQTKKMILLK